MASVLDYLQMFGMRKGATPEESLGAAEFWSQYRGRPSTPIQAQPGEATIQARQPGVMERVGYALQGDQRASLGQQRAIGTLRTLADLTPLAALDAKGPQEAALAILPGAGGPMGREAMAAAKQGIRAYHGSPHDFDRFRLSPETIGTGEGAQAYGHGLYFAGNENVARGYRDRLGHPSGINTPMPMIGGKPFQPGNNEILQIAQSETHPDRLVEKLSDYIKRSGPDNPYSHSEDAQRIIDAVKAGQYDAGTYGKMYEVNINASPERFLDWDKPLAQQPEAARGILPGRTSWGFEPRTGEDLYRSIAGEAKVGRVNPAGAEATATERLREAGIPGIKYLDQGSRRPGVSSLTPAQMDARIQTLQSDIAGGGGNQQLMRNQLASLEQERANYRPQTHNYVVFDDKLIDILRKYGLAGFGMLGAGGAALDQQQNR